jgi:hypothetical protein
MRGSSTYQAWREGMAELLAMDRSNVEDYVAIMQDSTEGYDASRRTFSSFSCFLNGAVQELPLDELRNSLSFQEAMSEPRNSSLLFLYSKEAEVANVNELDRLVWVQTRAQYGGPSPALKLSKQKRKRKDKGQKEAKTAVGKHRQPPLSSWIGKQLLGQNIPKRHLDKDGKLMMMERYPARLAGHSIRWLRWPKNSSSSR